MKPYVYVLVRKDISIAQQLVQASHATLEAGFEFNKPDEISSIVMLQVTDKEELMEAQERIERSGIKTKIFFEPDFDMGYSALATEPISDKKLRNIFRKYQLWH